MSEKGRCTWKCSHGEPCDQPAPMPHCDEHWEHHFSEHANPEQFKDWALPELSRLREENELVWKLLDTVLRVQAGALHWAKKAQEAYQRPS